MTKGRPHARAQQNKQPKEWLEIEPRVNLVAHRFEMKARRLIIRGGRAFEITATELINHAWECLIAETPAYDPSRQSLFKYFLRRMEDKFHSVCRDRAENDLTRYSYYEYAENVEFEEGNSPRVIRLEDPINEIKKIEARDELKKLLRWLATHQPDVYRLARVIALYGDVDPKDQAWRLCLSLNEIYDLRRRLKEAALRFRKITNI